MNRALRYFGGNKYYFVPFIVLFSAYALLNLYSGFKGVLVGYSYKTSAVFELLNIVMVLLLITALWLCAQKKIFLTAYFLSVAAFVIEWAVYFLDQKEMRKMYGRAFYNPYNTPMMICEILSGAALLIAVLMLWLKSNNKMKRIVVYMVILFIPMSDLITDFLRIKMFNFDRNSYEGFGRILFDIVPGILLIAVMAALWIPLNRFRICSRCARRNNMTAGFCGDCGSPLK